MVQELYVVGGVGFFLLLLISIPFIYSGFSGSSILDSNSSFLDLNDTPNSYSGFAGKFAQVNPTETGLIFSDANGASGSDSNQVKVSSNDTTPGFLEDKLQAGSNITLTVQNEGGDENILISATGGGGADTNCSTSPDCNQMYVQKFPLATQTIKGQDLVISDSSDNFLVVFWQPGSDPNNWVFEADGNVGILENLTVYEDITFYGTLSGGDFNYSLGDANGSQSASAQHALSSVGQTVSQIYVPTEANIDANALAVVNGLDLNNSLDYLKEGDGNGLYVLKNPTSSQTITQPNGVQFFINQDGNTSNSTSVGGAFNLNNTDNNGAGMILYTNMDSAANGRLLNIRCDHASYDQACAHVDYDGTANAFEIVNNSTDSSSQALNIVSTNPNDTTLGINGVETGKGTLKIVHNVAGGGDSAASAASFDLQGEGTQAQGLYIDSTSASGTRGDLLRLRNRSLDEFVVDANGNVEGADFNTNNLFPATSGLFDIGTSVLRYRNAWFSGDLNALRLRAQDVNFFGIAGANRFNVVDFNATKAQVKDLNVVNDANVGRNLNVDGNATIDGNVNLASTTFVKWSLGGGIFLCLGGTAVDGNATLLMGAC